MTEKKMMTGNSRELEMLDKAAAAFAQKQLAADIQENDRYPFGPFFDAVLQHAHAVDFFHATLPEKLGGMGQGMGAFCIILDNICRVDASLGAIIFTNAFAQKVIISAGSEALLQPIISSATHASQMLIAYPVFNNPAEVEYMARAARKNEAYVLTGTLEYLVLGEIATYAVVPARFREQTNYSFFLVNLSDERITKSDTVLSLGLHACPAIDIKFDDAEATLIGTEGEGNIYFERASDPMHAAVAAISAGIMKGCYQEALEYSRKRFQGGRKIFDWSEIRMILAEMAIKIKIAEMVVVQACQAVDQRLPQWKQCSYAAALHVQEMAGDVTTDGIQILGGAGYMEDHAQAKRYRDAKQAQSLLGMAPLKKLQYLQN